MRARRCCFHEPGAVIVKRERRKFFCPSTFDRKNHEAGAAHEIAGNFPGENSEEACGQFVAEAPSSIRFERRGGNFRRRPKLKGSFWRSSSLVNFACPLSLGLVPRHGIVDEINLGFILSFVEG